MHLALWLQSSLAGSPAGFVLGRLFTSLVMCAFPIYKVSLFVLAPCTSQSLLLPSKCPDGQKNVVLHLVFATLRELSQSQTTTSFFGGRTLRRNLGKGDGEISSHHLPPKKVSSDAIDASLWEQQSCKTTSISGSDGSLLFARSWFSEEFRG